MTSHATENAAYGGMFLFGIVIALLGAVLPLVSEPLGLGLAALGNLFVALNAAILAGSLVFHVHALVARGGWTATGEWMPVAYVDERAAEELFRHKVLGTRAEQRDTGGDGTPGR